MLDPRTCPKCEWRDTDHGHVIRAPVQSHYIERRRRVNTPYFHGTPSTLSWTLWDTHSHLTTCRAPCVRKFDDMSRPSYTGSTAGFGRIDTYSSRSAYPVFLSPQESGLLQLRAVGRGLLDAFRWDIVVRLIAR